MEGCDQGIEAVLSKLVGAGRGLEIVSRVNDIPKGRRLAVSTNILGSLIAICMRATGQVSQLTGQLTETIAESLPRVRFSANGGRFRRRLARLWRRVARALN